jgi:hypothetical protein
VLPTGSIATARITWELEIRSCAGATGLAAVGVAPLAV